MLQRAVSILIYLLGVLTASTATSVQELTDKTFDSFIAENKYAFVEFYAPWCGHCKNLVPEYARLPKVVQSLDETVAVAKIDSSEYQDISRKYGSIRTPSFRLFIEGSMIVLTLKRVHTAESLTEWIAGKLQVPFETLSDKEAVIAHTANDVNIVGFSSEKGSQFEHSFGFTARSIDDIPIAFVNGDQASNIATSLGVTNDLPTIAIFTHGSSYAAEVHTFEGDVDNPTQFINFVTEATTPVIQSMATYFPKLMKGDAGPQVVVLLFTNKANDKAWELARKVHGKAAVVQIDVSGTNANTNMIEAFGGTAGQESIVVKNGMIAGVYPDSAVVNDVEKLEAFIDGVIDGTIKPTLISAEAPVEPTANGLTTSLFVFCLSLLSSFYVLLFVSFFAGCLTDGLNY
jgi:thiol-disulfide isomerase/thioredoxin